MERLQKIIANAGVCSRRKAEELIAAGKVDVNGVKAKIGQSADPAKDLIVVDGKPLRSRTKKRYVLLNKPKGVETTLKSVGGLPTVSSLIREPIRLVPAGRLDLDSRGLVLMTNDGEMANRVMHPRYPLPKSYHVMVLGKITDDQVYRLGKGVSLDDGYKTRPCKITVLERSRGKTVLEMTLSEGKKRQIRRMLLAIGFNVHDLVRVRIGNLVLEGIDEGEYRDLTALELSVLKKLLKVLPSPESSS